MLKIKYFFVFVVIISLLGCKSSATLAEINALKKTVADKNFEFNANSAIPMAMANVRGIENLLPIGSNISNISLVGTPNFLIYKNDSLHIDMPYYGVRNLGVSYNSSDVGLKFKSKIQNVETSYNSKKKSFDLKYFLNNKQENLRITLTLYANNSGSLNVISSQRNSINYRGNWKSK